MLNKLTDINYKANIFGSTIEFRGDQEKKCTKKQFILNYIH